MRDHHLGSGAGHRPEGVMLGDPEAVKAESFDMLREPQRLSHRLGRGVCGANRRLIENGIADHRL